MALSVTHATVAAGTDAGNGEVHKAEWNAAHSLSMATARILGRVTGSAGAVEELTDAQVRTLINVADGSQPTSESLVRAALAALTAAANFAKGIGIKATGTYETQSTVETISYATGSLAWAWILEANHNLALYSFDPSTGSLIGSQFSITPSGDFSFNGAAVGVKLRDIGADHNLTVYVLNNLSANRDMSWIVPDSNISVTWPAGAYTLNTAPTFSSVSPSGTATITLSSLTRDSAYIGMAGLSHGDGTSRQLELYYSTNNGGAWTLWGNVLAAAVASSVTVYGGLTIHGLVSGNAVVLLPVTATSASPTLAATARTGSVSAGAQINALKLQWATGVNFDAGTATIKLFD